eukprot:PhF_6_TR4505/c2_g2_i3/m.6263
MNETMIDDRYSLLHTLDRDFKQIDEMDPSLSEGHRLIYDREVPFDLRTYETQTQGAVGTVEGVKVKVLALGEEPRLEALRVELSSESDLFFHYTCDVTELGFEQLRQDQKLTCDFASFSSMLLRLLNKCIRETQAYICILVLERDGTALLELVQNMEYKVVELLALPFRESSEHIVRQQVTFRYNALRSRIAMMTARMQDVNALVRVKNPALLSQIQRSGSSGLMMGGGNNNNHSLAMGPPMSPHY